MMSFGISRFVGSWVAASGHRLRIRSVRRDKACVDFFDPSGNPVCRPYMGGSPSLEMAAHYSDYDGHFEVDLWSRGRGFTLHLEHEEAYELDKDRREALVPGISRFEEDRFLDKFYPVFGQLEHFVRQNNPEQTGCRQGRKSPSGSNRKSSARPA
jgi:hypothetical protein